MYAQKFFRHPWTQEKIEFLIEWWPHWGTDVLAEKLGLTHQQIKSKVNRIRLTLLPKKQRICALCQKDFQVNRQYGVKCRSCFLGHRRTTRHQAVRPLEKIMRSYLQRKSVVAPALTVDHLLDLWRKQEGRCYYSGVPLQFDPPRTRGQSTGPFHPSLDRIVPEKGYVLGNIVWCCLACNLGKTTLSQAQYIDLCKKVSSHGEIS
jgi:hypothetical protein